MPLDALLGDIVNYIASYPEPYKNDLYKLLDELCESQFDEFNLEGLINAHKFKDEKDYILNRDFVFRFISVIHNYSTNPEFMLNFNCPKKGVWNASLDGFHAKFFEEIKKDPNIKYPRLAMMDFFSSFDANPYQPSKEYASVMLSYIKSLNKALKPIQETIYETTNEKKKKDNRATQQTN